MKRLFFLLFVLFMAGAVQAQENPPNPENKTSDSTCKSDELDILWTTADKEVFTKVVFPYGLNSKKLSWWHEVELIVWGPSSKLLAEDAELQEKIKEMMAADVRVTACKWCADQYGVSDLLAQLGIDVKYMGKPLTEYMKAGNKVLVF